MTFNLCFQRKISSIAVACSLLVPVAARADAISDVQVSVQGGAIVTDKSLYAGGFPGVSDFVTIDPGFAGSPTTGQDYGVLVTGKLWYHSGVVGEPISTAPGNPYLRIASGTSSFDLFQTSNASAALPLVENLNGSLHEHLTFSLFPDTGSPAPAGVYGVVLQVTSPAFGSSASFLIALANLNNAPVDMTAEGVEYGEQAILVQAVPEPTGAAIAGIGIAAVGLAAAKRRLARLSRREC